ncbi:MAG: matrixin family metalloprotease [Gemmataceae bacterium]|nr:matrixin family metalloprotease [Gemmataceae bacterium]
MVKQRLTPFRPAVEGLEARIVPYALSGYKWAAANVSASFMPDGSATDSSAPSNLFATLNSYHPTASWQREFARALQTWASYTPLNFRFVTESGSTQGDIRLGAYARSDSYVGYAYYPSGTSRGGDIFLNSQSSFQIGAHLDLYSVLLHESGHALGLGHSSQAGAVMYPTISGVFGGLTADDSAGIQAIYGTRNHDTYDSGSGNNALASATVLSLSSTGSATLKADLTGVADVDFFRFTAPTSFDGTLRVSVDARNTSLLIPKVSVFDSAGNLVGTASAGSAYGSFAQLTVGGLAPGQTYYVAADGETTDVFGMGAYNLSVQFGGVTAPPPAPTLPSLAISNVSLTEGNSGSKLFSFTVNLSAASTDPVTLQYTTANGSASAGSDYTATSGTLTFAPGETQQTISVTVFGDTNYEPDETFSVKLSSPTGATLAVSQGAGTIVNDDAQSSGPVGDRFEVNDSTGTATDLGKGNSFSQSGLSLHTPTDVDYYRFTPSKGGTFAVTVAPQGSGSVRVTVLDSLGNVVSSAAGESGSVRQTVSLTGGQRYFVRLDSPGGAVVGYDLGVARSGGSAGNGGGKGKHGGGVEVGHGTYAVGFGEADHDDHEDHELDADPRPGNSGNTSSPLTPGARTRQDDPGRQLSVTWARPANPTGERDDARRATSGTGGLADLMDREDLWHSIRPGLALADLLGVLRR